MNKRLFTNRFGKPMTIWDQSNIPVGERNGQRSGYIYWPPALRADSIFGIEYVRSEDAGQRPTAIGREFLEPV